MATEMAIMTDGYDLRWETGKVFESEDLCTCTMQVASLTNPAGF